MEINWKTLSRAERKSAKAIFTIPDDVKTAILPSSDLSLLEMLRYRLPPVSLKRTHVMSREKFFSTTLPTAIIPEHLTRLRELPIPPSDMVHKLMAIAGNRFATGACSVSYAHVTSESITYPMFIIPLWNAILLHREQCQNPWIEVEKWLAEMKRSPHHEERSKCADSTLTWMDEVPWGMKKMGFPDTLPMVHLWRLLGQNWTNDTVQDDLLTILQERIDADSKLAEKFIIQCTSFTEKVLEAAAHPDKYWTEKSWKWLRDIGEQVFGGKKVLITSVHLGKLPSQVEGDDGTEHWVPFIIDGEQDTFRYGDTLASGEAQIPPKLLDAYMKWRAVHSATQLSPAIVHLRMTKQRDGFSCRPLLWNGLENFVFPEETPLCAGSITTDDIPCLRMHVFEQIVRRCLHYVHIRSSVNIHRKYSP